MYGVRETNNISMFTSAFGEFLDQLEPGSIQLDDPRLLRITRLRLLTEPGFPYYDVSYCYGQLKDGRHVRVDLPWHQLHRATWKQTAVSWGKENHVWVKGLGLFNDDVISMMW
jgi:hypothetical protein